MLTFFLVQLWFALFGRWKHPETGKVIRSKDGVFKRLRLLARLTFSREAFGAMVEGQAAQLAELIIQERDAQVQRDREAASVQRDRSTHRQHGKGRR